MSATEHPRDPDAAAGPAQSGTTGQLVEILYEELRGLARARMAREAPGQTLQATALVHEAYLRLAATEPIRWENRAHFFAAAAEAMRRILIDRARRRQAARHGGGMERVDAGEFEMVAPGDDTEMLRVHEALQRLAECDPEKAALVNLKYFAGLTFEEVADVLGCSVPTAKRHWTYARAWLFRELDSTST